MAKFKLLVATSATAFAAKAPSGFLPQRGNAACAATARPKHPSGRGKQLSPETSPEGCWPQDTADTSPCGCCPRYLCSGTAATAQRFSSQSALGMAHGEKLGTASELNLAEKGAGEMGFLQTKIESFKAAAKRKTAERGVLFSSIQPGSKNQKETTYK